MKIALVCTSLGYSRRGFERFTLELFEQINHKLSVTLFGCRLNGKPNAVSLPCLKFDGLLRVFEGRARDNYYFQQLSYGLSFIPFVGFRGYDIVHYSEPALGHFLFYARKVFGFRYKLLFTDGLGLDPRLDQAFLEQRDHIQAITEPHHQTLMRSGANPKKVSFIPYGVDSSRYVVKRNSTDLRTKYGIPKDKTVILTVAALNRRHKRIDYLIREVSRLKKDYFLLVVGQPEEPDLATLGKEMLGENFKTLYVPFDQVSEIYHLADLFVFPCLVGEFGLALAEAMCSDVPVIAHSHFEWMTGPAGNLADLSQEGNLARKIDHVMSNYEEAQKTAGQIQRDTVNRFDWDHLVPKYLDMYESVYQSGTN